MKKYDAVQNVREIRDKIYERTKNKSDEELIVYYQKIAEKAISVQKTNTEYHHNDK